MLNGASKYLALRESVARLALNPRLSAADKFQQLSDFQDDYASLDESYSKFFSIATLGRQFPSSAAPLNYQFPSNVKPKQLTEIEQSVQMAGKLALEDLNRKLQG